MRNSFSDYRKYPKIMYMYLFIVSCMQLINIVPTKFHQNQPSGSGEMSRIWKVYARRTDRPRDMTLGFGSGELIWSLRLPILSTWWLQVLLRVMVICCHVTRTICWKDGSYPFDPPRILSTRHASYFIVVYEIHTQAVDSHDWFLVSECSGRQWSMYTRVVDSHDWFLLSECSGSRGLQLTLLSGGALSFTMESRIAQELSEIPLVTSVTEFWRNNVVLSLTMGVAERGAGFVDDRISGVNYLVFDVWKWIIGVLGGHASRFSGGGGGFWFIWILIINMIVIILIGNRKNMYL